MDSQDSKEINVTVTCADEDHAVLRFEGFGAPAHSVAIEWRSPGESGDRIPVAVTSNHLPPSGTCEVRIALDELWWATSPSRNRNRDDAPYLVVLDRAGRELAHSAQPVDKPQPRPARATTLFERWRGQAKAAAAEDQPSRAASAAAGGAAFARDEAESVVKRVGTVALLVTLLLGVLALAPSVVLATLGAADVEETIKVEAGSKQFACLGGKARLPSKFGILEAAAGGVTKGRIDIKADKNPNGREGCEKNLVEISATPDVPPGPYPVTYRVIDFVFEKSAALKIEVEEGANLDAVNIPDIPCLRQGESVMLSLAGNVTPKAKGALIAAHVDPPFGPVTVGQPEPNHPFRLKVTASRNTSGIAEIKFHFSAGTKSGKPATVRILSVQPSCRPPAPLPGTGVVPMRHGFILADFGPNFSRQPGGALPRVNIVTAPRLAKAHVAGQFIILTDLNATPGQQDSIDYTVAPPNRPAESRHLDIVYDDVCSSVVQDEELLYMPAGEYFEPPAGPGVSQLFFANLATVPGVNRTRGSVTVGQPYCLQTHDIRRILNAVGVDPNRLKGMSFESVNDLAKHMSNSAGKTYSLPKTSQWIAGLILALGIGDSQAGDPAFNAAFKDSYLSGVHEWIDQTYGMGSPPQYYLFGPSTTEPDKWITWQKRGFTSQHIGGRLVREP